jgi:hypothetical protein
LWRRLCPYPFCPTYRQFARILALALIGLLCWGVVYTVLGDTAAPGGQLFELSVLCIAAHFGGWLMSLTTLPALVGMLMVGILFQNVGLVRVGGDYMGVVSVLRYGDCRALWELRYGDSRALWQLRYGDSRALWQLRYGDSRALWELRYGDSRALWQLRYGDSQKEPCLVGTQVWGQPCLVGTQVWGQPCLVATQVWGQPEGAVPCTWVPLAIVLV